MLYYISHVISRSYRRVQSLILHTCMVKLGQPLMVDEPQDLFLQWEDSYEAVIEHIVVKFLEPQAKTTSYCNEGHGYVLPLWSSSCISTLSIFTSLLIR